MAFPRLDAVVGRAGLLHETLCLRQAADGHALLTGDVHTVLSNIGRQRLSLFRAWGHDRRHRQQRLAAAAQCGVVRQRLADILRIAVQMRGKHEGPAGFGRQRRALFTGAEQKALGGVRRQRCGAQARFGVVVQVGGQLRQLLRECRFVLSVMGGLQRLGGERQPAGRFAYPEIDAPRRQRRQQVKVFGYLVGAVVLQHHAARADANARRLAEQVADQYFRRRAGELRRVVVFRQPETPIAPAFRLLRQMQRARQRQRGAFPVGDRTFFQYAQGISHFPAPLIIRYA